MAQLQLTRQGQATAAGTLVLSFPSIASGQYWLCSLVVPNAPASATGTVFVATVARFPILGSQPSALIEAGGGTVSVALAGLVPGSQVTAQVLGGVFTGVPPGTAPTGPSTLTSIVGGVKATLTGPVDISGPVTVQGTLELPPVTVKVTELPGPPVPTVGVYTGRRPLTGTTTRVTLIPSTRTATYFENLKIGWRLWSTPANTGTWIWIGVAAGTTTPETWARIPSGKTKLMGVFGIDWGNAWTVRIAGKTGDHVNVWAA